MCARPPPGLWSQEQHHRWSPRQEGGDLRLEETETLEPRPGNHVASLCTQPQTVWTPPQGWGEASPTPLDSELCVTQRRAATLAAGAGTRARDFAATAHLLYYCAEQDRSLAYF